MRHVVRCRHTESADLCRRRSVRDCVRGRRWRVVFGRIRLVGPENPDIRMSGFSGAARVQRLLREEARGRALPLLTGQTVGWVMDVVPGPQAIPGDRWPS